MKKLMTMVLLSLTISSAMGQDAKETYMKGVLALNAQNYELAAMYFESAANERVPKRLWNGTNVRLVWTMHLRSMHLPFHISTVWEWRKTMRRLST